jgi:hypothetical protein
MPWKIKEKDGKYCVVKKSAPEGEAEVLKCYTDKEDAVKYLRALYANAEESMSIKVSNLEAPSLTERIQKIQEAFHQPTQDAIPVRNYYIKEIYDAYVLVTDGTSTYKVGYTMGEDGVVNFVDSSEWKKQKMVDASISYFVFTELQGIPGVFDGLAASHDISFTSMSGEELFIEPADLEEYIQNGQAVIESTRTSTGDIIGLPIDMNGHDHKGGAGWIQGFELDKARNIVKFIVDWTEEGADLIKRNLRRFFSPTVDPINKIILGGSLTNWPATRNSMGQLLLAPIELSQGMKGIDMPPTLEELMARLDEQQKELNALKALRKPAPAAPDAEELSETEEVSLEISNLLQDDDAVDQLGQLAQEKAKEIIRVAHRKSHVVEFVSKVVGGTPDHPVGLPIAARELTKILLSLPEKQSLAVERLLAKVWDSALDFSEHGIATGDQFNLRKPVPAPYNTLLSQWVGSGKSAKSFFEVNPEAGNAEDYNLSMYTQKAEA